MFSSKLIFYVDQINIPKQNVVEYWSEFTPVERYFYNREYELSTSEFSEKVRRYNENTPLKLLNKSTFKEVRRSKKKNNFRVDSKYLHKITALGPAALAA